MTLVDVSTLRINPLDGRFYFVLLVVQVTVITNEMCVKTAKFRYFRSQIKHLSVFLTHFRVWIAVARHNLKWVVIKICQFGWKGLMIFRADQGNPGRSAKTTDWHVGLLFVHIVLRAVRCDNTTVPPSGFLIQSHRVDVGFRSDMRSGDQHSWAVPQQMKG